MSVRNPTSYLFVPANDSRRVPKALQSEADAAILDLEDAVAVSEKSRAREGVVQALGLARRVSLFARMNGIHTGLALDDLEAIMGPGLDGVMVPKVESAGDIAIVDWLISELERRRGMRPGSVIIVALVETAEGIAHASEIASSSPRLSRLAFGAIDYCVDMRVSLVDADDILRHARARLAVASRAVGLVGPIDTVFADLQDEEGLVREARLARAMGFGAKMVIHPGQIEKVNQIFSPTDAELAWARRVVEAFDAAEAGGRSSIQVDGKFIDYAVVASARQLLEGASQNR
jgi:citrate lyase subunit beta/citryl-CoA lyase